MVSATTIPVVNIHVDNLVEFWPAITLGISSSTFIALDLEMSGIGNRKETMARDTQERYKAFCEIAKTRAVLALGISVFKKANKVDEAAQEDNIEFVVQTFNVMVLSEDSFVVEPNSLKFLVEHDFDFNKHYAKGIPYNRNHTKGNTRSYTYTITNLFYEILKSSKPVVFHNGILDLVFLYENFYANLPSTLLTFLADLSEMFTAGIFDTKYITEYHTDYSASYLNYTFKKSWRSNIRDDSEKKHVNIKCPDYPVTVDVYYNKVVNTSSSDELPEPCVQYALHGHCPKGMKCEMSHNIDVILDVEDRKKKKKRRKRKRHGNGETQLSNSKSCDKQLETKEMSKSTPTETGDESSNLSDSVLQEPSLTNHETVAMETNNISSGNHRAGFDAFMTGFVMADFLVRFGKSHESPMAENVSNFVNKLNLSGKNVPLTITKSQYSKTSIAHKDMWSKIISDR